MLHLRLKSKKNTIFVLKLVTAVLCCFIHLPTFAQELDVYNQSVRQQGMGGVYVFRDDDASSMLQNPAYTCYTEGMNWTLMGVGLGLNNYENYTQVQEVSKTISDNGGTMTLASLTPLYGRRFRTSFGGQTTLTLPCFGFSIWSDNYVSFKLENPVLPNLNIKYQSDYALQFALAFPIGPVKFGLAPKRVTRTGGAGDFGAANINGLTGETIKNSIGLEGAAYAIDIGLAIRRSELPFNPTFSLAWKDVGTTTFLPTSSKSTPERQKDNMTFGLTFDGSIPLFGVSGGIEYRHAGDTGVPFSKKFHTGVEVTLATFDFRAGFYQGYPTYGLGVDLLLATLEASYYQVETGTYAGQAGDPRYNVSLLFNLGFDPDFNLVATGGGTNGKRRALKQRR